MGNKLTGAKEYSFFSSDFSEAKELFFGVLLFTENLLKVAPWRMLFTGVWDLTSGWKEFDGTCLGVCIFSDLNLGMLSSEFFSGCLIIDFSDVSS
jgi:hypothetical protein